MANLIPASEMARLCTPEPDTRKLPEIFADDVIAEYSKRCANGMQYTTFPNSISNVEKAKLVAAGYIVTENTVPSAQRHGAGDLYIGFQVALNKIAAEKAMQIVPDREIEDIGDTLDSVDSTTKSTLDMLTQTKASVDTGNVKIDAVGAKVSTVNNSINSFKQSMDTAMQSTVDSISQTKSSVDTGNSKIDSVGTKVSSVNTTLHNFKSAVDTANNQIKSDLSNIKDKVNTTADDVAAIKEKVTATEDEPNNE